MHFAELYLLTVLGISNSWLRASSCFVDVPHTVQPPFDLLCGSWSAKVVGVASMYWRHRLNVQGDSFFWHTYTVAIFIY